MPLETHARGEASTEPLVDRTAAARALFARISRRSTRIVVPINDAAADPESPAPSFFCVHSLSGAGGADFTALARRMGGAVRFFGVQAPPARLEEEGFGADLHALGASYAEAVAATAPTGPIRLGGWSAGAPIALVVAHQLRSMGREVDLLVAIEGGPEIPHEGLSRLDPRYWLRVAANLPAWWTDSRKMSSDFPQGPAWRFLVAMVARLRFGSSGSAARARAETHIAQFGSMDRYPRSHQRFMRRLYAAIMSFRPDPWDGPVVVYEASIKPAVTLPQFFERWRMIAAQVERVRLEGNHVTVMRDPWVAQLASDLARRLDAARAVRR